MDRPVGNQVGRPVDGCTHKNLHLHGTPNAYQLCGCRCSECKRGIRNYMKQLQLGIKRGEVDATTIRKHIVRLMTVYSTEEIGEMAGCTANALRRVMRRPITTVKTARKIANIPLPKEALPLDSADWYVPGLASQRRLHALSRAGYSIDEVASETGIDRSCIEGLRTGRQKRTSAKNEYLIKVTAERLCLKPKPIEAIPPAWRDRFMRYPPLMAWDEDTIGDPSAKPQGRRRYRKKKEAA